MDEHCVECGKCITGKPYPGGMCQGCYKYFHNGGSTNPIPEKGIVARDHRGYIVCHICGRAYKRLGSHIKESHGMTITKYKENFGLCNNAKTTETIYSSHMRQLAYKYDMPQRLQESGKRTRIKPGEKKLRLGKKSRQQECLERSERNKRSKT